MGHAITLELSDEEYGRAEKLAAAVRADLRSVLGLVIRHALPPNLEPVALDELSRLPDRELEARAHGRFPASRRSTFEQLRRKQQESGLTPAEESRLETLLDEYQQAELDMARAQAVLAIRRQIGATSES